MKKTVLFIFLALLNLISFSQETDTSIIIFPIRGEPIKNAKIIETGPGNTIIYSNGNDTSIVLAKAYIENGELINVFNQRDALKKDYSRTENAQLNSDLDLEENKDYFFHKHNYRKYKRYALKGVPFIAVGGGLMAIGGIWYAYEKIELSDDNIANDYRPVYIFVSIGGAFLTAGTIVLGVNLSIASTHKKEMNRIKNNNISLNIGMQQSGFGLCLKF